MWIWNVKVQIFWEGHKIWPIFHSFLWHYLVASNYKLKMLDGPINFCGLLRIFELEKHGKNGVKIQRGLHKWFKPYYGRDDLVKQNELGHMSETNVNVEGHT